MHDPGFRQQFVAQHTHQLESRGRYARPSWAPESSAEDVTLRLCTVQDDPALERLAQLESRELPDGRLVVAEVDGELVAAVPLGGRSALRRSVPQDGPPAAAPARAGAAARRAAPRMAHARPALEGRMSRTDNRNALGTPRR